MQDKLHIPKLYIKLNLTLFGKTLSHKNHSFNIKKLKIEHDLCMFQDNMIEISEINYLIYFSP